MAKVCANCGERKKVMVSMWHAGSNKDRWMCFSCIQQLLNTQPAPRPSPRYQELEEPEEPRRLPQRRLRFPRSFPNLGGEIAGPDASWEKPEEPPTRQAPYRYRREVLREENGEPHHTHDPRQCTLCVQNERIIERYEILVKRATQTIEALRAEREAALAELKSLEPEIDSMAEDAKLDQLNRDIEALSAQPRKR